MSADLSALREMILQGLEDAQRSVERHQAMLDAIDAGCMPVSGSIPSPPVYGESDFDEINLISTGQAAKFSGYQKDTIRDLCEEKKIGIKVGGRWRVSFPLLKQYMGASW